MPLAAHPSHTAVATGEDFPGAPLLRTLVCTTVHNPPVQLRTRGVSCKWDQNTKAPHTAPLREHIYAVIQLIIEAIPRYKVMGLSPAWVVHTPPPYRWGECKEVGDLRQEFPTMRHLAAAQAV